MTRRTIVQIAVLLCVSPLGMELLAQCAHMPLPERQGWAKGSSVNFWFRPSDPFSGDQILCIAAGIQSWNGNVTFNYSESPQAGGIEVRMDDLEVGADAAIWQQHDPDWRDRPITAGHMSFGYDGGGGFFGMGGCDEVLRVAAHETGHSFGLPNLNIHRSESIMAIGSGGYLDYPPGPNLCDRDGELLSYNYLPGSGPHEQYPDTEYCGGLNFAMDEPGCCYDLWRVHSGYGFGHFNVKPMVHISNLVDGGWYGPVPPTGAPGIVTVHVDDLDGAVWRVDYYLNGQLAHVSTTSPFTWNVPNVVPGTYTVQVAAYDNSDNYALSQQLTVHVY